MKDVMISIRPKWCELEATGEKTIEVRKTRPNTETPFKCRIYCTAIKDKKRYSDEFDIPINTRKWCGNGKVIGEFVCDKIEVLEYLTQISNIVSQKGHTEIIGCINVDPFYNGKIATIQSTLLSNRELVDYGKSKPLYAWHISDLKIYDKPKELSDFNYYNKCVSNCENVDCCKTNAIANECEGYTPCAITRPPQSWCYCEELEDNENE